MKVRITFEATDELRRAINEHYGIPGKANYAEVKRWFTDYGYSANDDLLVETNDNEGES